MQDGTPAGSILPAGGAPQPLDAYPAPMKITVKLFATLRRGRFDREILDLDRGSTVRDVTGSLGIPDREAAIIFIDSRHADLDTVLAEGANLSIFPPIGGG